MSRNKRNRDLFDVLFNTPGGHTKNKRGSTHDKHTGARRDSGSGRPNTKSEVRQRHQRNQR